MAQSQTPLAVWLWLVGAELAKPNVYRASKPFTLSLSKGGQTQFVDWSIGWGRSALGRLGWFANLPLGGGGLRAEAAVLNNPAARCKPTAGKAPSYGPTFAGRSRHAIPGLALPFAVILTAHRLRSPLRPARQTAWTLAWNSKATIHALKTNCRSKRSSRCFSREIRLSRNRLGSIIDTSQALVGWR